VCRDNVAFMARQRPQDTPSLDATQFWEVVNTGIRAGQETQPIVEQASADDLENPYYRAALAVRDLLGEESPMFSPAMTRFTALMDLYGRHALDEWLRPSPKGGQSHDIHPAIIDIAARMRLSDNGRFAQRKFLDAVETQAAKWYADFDEWEAPGAAARDDNAQ